MRTEPSRGPVDAEELQALGFSQALIEEAVLRAEAGVLEVEPAPDLVQRTIDRCAAAFPHAEASTASRELQGELAVSLLRQLSPWEPSSVPAVLEALGKVLSSQWKGLLQEYVGNALQFALAKHQRPLLMVENHNLINPTWWESDRDFHSLGTACDGINKIVTSFDIEPSARVVVLRPPGSAYTPQECGAVQTFLRDATSDVYWLSVARAAEYAQRDVTVVGDTEVLEMTARMDSPQQALHARTRIDDPLIVTTTRNLIQQTTAWARPIKIRGEFMAADIATAVRSDPVEGMRKLLEEAARG